MYAEYNEYSSNMSAQAMPGPAMGTQAQSGSIKDALSVLFPNYSAKKLEGMRQRSTPGWQFLKRVLIFIVIIITFGITYQVMIGSNPEEWSHPTNENDEPIVNGIYFASVVSGTVGFGDYYPFSKRAMFVVSLNVLVAWIAFQTLLN